MFEIADEQTRTGCAKIKVIGVGGGGCNAVNTMIRAGLEGVDYIVANTDAQALSVNLAPTKIQLGASITKGLGAGANPEVGRKAAMEEYDKLTEILEDADMVFVTAGMGGGTGTGAAPVIAHLAKELGALTVGVVTKPFLFEGKKRLKQAIQGISSLEESVDSLICIPNQRLLQVAGEDLSLVDTFKKADDVLLNAVRGISDLINNTGLINADFADVRTVMANKGMALMGTGVCSGPDRSLKAAQEAISSPLLEDVSIDGATGIIINITGNEGLTTSETNRAVTLIMEAADEDAEIIFGTVIDPNMNDELKITVIATGLQELEAEKVVPGITQREIVKPIIEKPVITQPAVVESIKPIISEMKTVEVPPVFDLDEVKPIEEIREKIFAAVQENNMAEDALDFFLEDRKEEEPILTLDKIKEETIPSVSDEIVETKNKAKSIAERLGFFNFDEDEFDGPAYLRKGDNRPQI